MWKDYFPAVDAIVFLIDCVDRARFPESKVELDSLLTDDQLSNCPVVILGNKVNTIFSTFSLFESVLLNSSLYSLMMSLCFLRQIDIPGAASEDELRQVFGLYGQTTGKGKVSRSELPGRPLELFMCSVLKRQGYGEGFRWISQYLD